MDIDTNINKHHIPINGLLGLVYLLQFNRYFRQLFYYRIGSKVRFLKFFFPGEKTFIIGTQELGGGIYLAHPFATILNAKSIGINFTCHQCTTIGNKKDGRNDLIPKLGNNVCVGANVVIIGNVNIGSNVIIGAGSVVVKDIPDNCIVAGNPAVIIKRLQ